MSNAITRIIELLLPYGLVRKCDSEIGGITHPLTRRGFGIMLLLDWLPYFVAATLQQVKPTDRSLVKYFTPYGYMVDYLKRRYGMNLHAPKHWLQHIMPYGLVLWWEAADRRQQGKLEKASASAFGGVVNADVARVVEDLKTKIDSLQHEMRVMDERNKVLMLRILCLLQEQESSQDEK